MNIIILAARVNSSRFPRKCFADIWGKPMIQRIIDRLKLCQTIDKIIIATCNEEDNKTLGLLAVKNGIPIDYGEEGELIEQYLRIAQLYQADKVVRITGDCPLIDPWVVDSTVERFTNCDISTNHCPPTFPKGLASEVFNIKTLKRLDKEAANPEYRKNLTLHIYKNQEDYNIKNVTATNGENWYDKYNFCVDYYHDLEYVKKIYSWCNNNIIPWRLEVEALENGRI
jgi:spore coat polysaccharide biosynthesis protein SpsF (cytidylyltransferase family)